jgi:hypothetical protein
MEVKIKSLSSKADYALWCLRVQSYLQNLRLWNEDKKQPLDNAQASSILISLISDELLEQILSTNLTAPTIWKYFPPYMSPVTLLPNPPPLPV